MEPKKMEPTRSAFHHHNMTYTLPIPLQSIRRLWIEQKINDHATLTLTGLAPESFELKDLEGLTDQAPIEIHLTGYSTPYFAGVCTEISLEYESGLKTITLEAKSWTHCLDITKKSRSYQKLNISYEDFIGEVLKDYPKKDYRVALPPGRKYQTFAVQYWETDWEFLKRMAAREGTVLIPEYTDSQQTPRFWLGLPELKTQELVGAAEKGMTRDLKRQLDLRYNQDPSVKDQDCLTYETTGYHILHLGDRVHYQNQTLKVLGIHSQLEQGELTHRYTLGHSEKSSVSKPDNMKLMGAALPGKVLESRGINCQIHLAIDDKQEKSEALWFPYAAASNNVLYCMPEKGETINLYFRDGWEENAIAISGARKNGGSCRKTSNYNNRYFASPAGRELFLSPDTLSFTADEGAAEPITIQMLNDSGIVIASQQDIVMKANVNMNWQAPKEITMEGTLGCYLCAGSSSITLKQDLDIFGSSRVELYGRVSNNFTGMDGLDMLGNQYDDWREEHPVCDFIVGCIPFVGALPEAWDAYKAFQKGDMLSAAYHTGMAAISCIPGGGVVKQAGKKAAEVGFEKGAKLVTGILR